MRARKLVRLCVVLPLALVGSAATAQTRLCSTVPAAEREFVRSIGACRDVAPIVDVVPGAVDSAPSVIVAVPNVVGLGFDDASNRLTGFSLRRSYRPSAAPGGTVLEQQPATPARLAAGAIVRLVLSDGTLRPAPRVSAAEIDGLPSPASPQTDVRPQPAATSDDARAGKVIEQGPEDAAGQSSSATPSPRVSDRAGIDRLVVPNVGGMMLRDAQARLGNFRVQRRERPSSAPIGRVVEQVPKASARAALGSVVTLVVSSGPARAATPVIETFELPNVIGRSYAEASGALSEFKVARIEKASDAPSGQVLAQDPAPGTSVKAGSAIGLQVSDGSLARGAATTPVGTTTPAGTTTPPATTPAAVTTPAAETTTPAAETTSPAAETTPPAVTAPAVETAPTAATPAVETAPAAAAPSAETTTPGAATPPATSATLAPAQSNRLPVTFPSSATLLLIAGVLAGAGLGALLTRRWFLRRQPTEDVELPAPTRAAPAEIVGMVAVPVTETAPEIRFAARLDAGETTIEFAAPSDADETTMEHSRELHE